MVNRFIRKQEVLRITGLSDSTLARLEHTGEFPRRCVLSPRSVGWPEDEVLNWIEARRAAGGGANDEVRL